MKSGNISANRTESVEICLTLSSSLGSWYGRLVSLTDSLNAAQREAVLALDGPLLVLAGAGSGKTRVLTHRIAHLVLSGTAFPGEIFAVTFTNKAAREMRERVEKLLHAENVPTHDLWISTFHSSGARILRTYAREAGLEPGFTILDDQDQQNVIKHVMEDLGISDKMIAPRMAQHRLNQLKNEGIDPSNYEPMAKSFTEQKLIPIFKAYEAKLRATNSVDFGDLLFKCYEVFRKYPDVRNAFAGRYRYVLVDEYQDTNVIQYKFLQLLAGDHRNICVVGDEDQCIYKWRGADIRNILDFERDFPGAKVVKLEENYRSSGHIIAAANGVIARNSQRKPKELFTSKPDGELVEVHLISNDIEEARWVVQQVQKQVQEGRGAADFAIFYRTNAQSRLLEDNLRLSRLPYRVFGGQRFYERAEIKDALCYLRMFANPRDDLSVMRVINVPTRGIGRSTIDTVRGFATKEGCSFLEAVGRAVQGEEESLGSGPRKKLAAFLELYNKMQMQAASLGPRDFYALLLDESGYLKALRAEDGVESEARIENLEELGNVLAEYESRAETPTLIGFLEEAALITDMDRAQVGQESVTLMTLHSAKGLEFPIVFVTGMEEELFPSARSVAEGEDVAVEEERRLCYVGMTRAMERLYLTSAQQRRVFGTTHVRRPSRFLAEIPEEHHRIHDHAPERPAMGMRRFSLGGGDDDYGFGGSSTSFDSDFSQEAPPDDGFQTGVKVKHPDFGEGQVVRREGWGEAVKVSVAFERWGTKKFLVKYAPLERLR